MAIVLSTTSGTPAAWATSAMPAMSSTTGLGLPIVSPKKALVLGRMAARHCSRSLGSSTKLTSMPNFGRVNFSRLIVPP